MPPQKPQDAPDFIPAGPDFIPANGGQDAPPKSQPQPYAPETDPAVAGTAEAVGGPMTGMAIPMIQSGIQGARRIGGELSKAFQGAKEGNPYSVMAHGAQAIPFIGAGLQSGSDAMPPFHGEGEGLRKAFTTPSVIGSAVKTAAEVAPMALMGADAVLPDRPLTLPLPSRSRAGEVFSSIKNQVGDQPVNLTQSSEPLTRAFELSQRGANAPKVIRQLANRVTEPGSEPLTYSEARDFASNIADLSRKDLSKMNGPLRAQVGELKRAFNQDIGSTAETAGRGEDYANALKEYARASRLKNAAQTAGKLIIPTGAAGIGYEMARKLAGR